MIVVNNYDLGTDVIPEEEQIVPDPLVTDVGKVLTVNQAGNPEWEDAPEELPALTGNAGKVLTVSSGSSGVEWAEVPEELPAVTSADAGDVLTVNASGEWEAAAPGGGGGGLTLYGPYVCKNQAATIGTSATEVYMDTYDLVSDVNQYIPPSDDEYETFITGTIFKPVGVDINEILMLYRRENTASESNYITLYASAESSMSISAGDLSFLFFSTQPFRLVE